MLDFTREGGTGGNQHGNPEGSAHQQDRAGDNLCPQPAH